MARASRRGANVRLPELGQLLARGRRAGRRAGGRTTAAPSTDARGAGAPEAARSCPSRRAARRLGLDRVADEPVGRRRRSGSRPAAAACSRRAATLTASPVTSVSPLPVDDLAGVDADPQLELRDGVAQLERCARRAQRVVLVHLRDPEHRHHRVADELLDARAVAFEDRARLSRSSAPSACASPRGRAARRARSSR